MLSCRLCGKEASEAVACVGEHLPSFSDKAQVNLAREILESVETDRKHDGAAFEVLSRVLARLSAKEGGGPAIDYDGEAFVSGAAFRAHVVTLLTGAVWSSSFVVNLLGVFKEAVLTESEQKQLCEKGLFMMQQVDYSVLPSLVYQLLLFKYKNKGEIVVRIAEFFEAQESKARVGKLPPGKAEQLRQTEGTLLLHVDVAMKQDSSLASSFLKTLQKESNTRSTFMTAFLLALSRSPRHQEAVNKLLMAMVTSGVEEDAISNSHAWASGALKNNDDRQSGAIRSIFLDTIQRAQHGWQVIVQPLVALAVACIETKTKNKSTAELLRALGSEMLESTFQLHESAQSEILAHVFSRIAATGPETPAFIHLLSVLVSKFKHQVMHSELKLREAFEYLTYLKPAIGLQMVDAILPLMTGTKAFQDHLIIVFRKAMFRGDLTSRLTAVGGFARWISYDTLEVDVAYDIIGFLNRALTQQLEVRRVVYGCLEELLHKQKDSVRMVMDMLSDQISRYLSDNGKKINLKGCVEGETINEPIGTLISTAQRCAKYALANNAPESSTAKRADALLQRVLTLVKLVEDAELTEFDLDKTTDFSERSAAARGALLLSLYVACTETIVGSSGEDKLSEDAARRISMLFVKHSELLEAMRKRSEENSEAGAEKKKRKGAVASAGAAATAPGKLVLPIEQLIGCKEMLVLLEALAKPEQDTVSQLLRNNKPLHRWIVSHVLQLVHTQLLVSDDAVVTAQNTRRGLDFCVSMGPLVMAEYKRDNDKEASLLLAEALLQIVDFFTKHGGDQAELANFLGRVNPLGKAGADAQSNLQDQIRSILSFIPPLVSSKGFKEVLVIFRLCKLLIQSLRPEKLNSLQKTTTELLVAPMDNATAASALVELYLEICEKNGEAKKGAELLVRDLQLRFGTVDYPDRDKQVLGILGDKTWSTVGLLALGVVERLVAETEWAHGILKGTDASSGRFEAERLRQATYVRMGEAVALLDGMAHVVFPLGVVKDTTLKLATRSIKVLYNMVKTFAKQKHVPAESFASLIKACGQLISKLYTFMSKLEEEGADEEDESKPVSKKQKQKQAAQAKKDEKIQPALIYEIERLETSLIKYQKQCKMTLMANWVRSVERGYQVDLKKISSIVQKRNERGEDDEAEGEEAQGSKKKQKKGAAKKKPASVDPDPNVEESPAPEKAKKPAKKRADAPAAVKKEAAAKKKTPAKKQKTTTQD